MIKGFGDRLSAGRVRKSLRDIIEINDELCDGCGECLPSCAEGALILEDGKLVLKDESLCDGLGACLGSCPKGALSVTRRFSDAFVAPGPDHGDKTLSIPKSGPPMSHIPMPTAATESEQDLTDLINALEHTNTIRPWPGLEEAEKATIPKPEDVANYEFTDAAITLPGERRALISWPIQLALVPPRSSIFSTSTMVLAADCVAFASPYFHGMFLEGRNPLVIGCPKLDDCGLYEAKLSVILRDNPHVTEVRLPIMDVPCCRGLWRLAREALKRSKRHDVRLLGWLFSASGRPLESSINLNLEHGD
jgi:NAD-dependent dihydropyrimidine dehydrogenase PreA subunit